MLGPLHERVFKYWLDQLPDDFADRATFSEFFQAQANRSEKRFVENNFLQHHSLGLTQDSGGGQPTEKLPFILLHNVTTILAALALHSNDKNEVSQPSESDFPYNVSFTTCTSSWTV